MTPTRAGYPPAALLVLCLYSRGTALKLNAPLTWSGLSPEKATGRELTAALIEHIADLWGNISLQEYGLTGAACTIKPTEEHIKAYVDKLFAGKTPSAQPHAYFLAGGSGSGKSSVSHKVGIPFDTAIVADIDDIMMNLFKPAEKKDMKKMFDCAGKATDVMTNFLKKAISGGYDLIRDGTGATSFPYTQLNQNLIKQGYKTSMLMVYVPEKVAQERVKKRADETGRQVPPSVV